MYEFILGQWVMRKFTEEQVDLCVTKGYITQEQAAGILSERQISTGTAV
jgi:hypothetical protein